MIKCTKCGKKKPIYFIGYIGGFHNSDYISTKDLKELIGENSFYFLLKRKNYIDTFCNKCGKELKIIEVL